MGMKRSGWFVAGALFFLPATLPAQTATGASFLQITPSPRSYALGMSKGVTSLGAQAVGANPANLGLMTKRFEVFSSYGALMGGAQYQHLSAAFKASAGQTIDALGVSVTRLGLGNVQGADANGNMTGDSFSGADTAVSLTGSASLSPNLRVGLTGKALQSEIAGYKSNMVLASDLGLTYTFPQLSRPLSIGASVTNLGQGMRFLDQTDPLPTSVNLGAAFLWGPAMIIMEANRLMAENKTEMGMGLEWGLGPVAFRTGYLGQSESSNNLALKDQPAYVRMLSGLSFGLGLQVGAVNFEYAVSQMAVEYGTTHRVAMTLRWGAPRVAAASSEWKLQDRSDWLIRPMGSY